MQKAYFYGIADILSMANGDIAYGGQLELGRLMAFLKPKPITQDTIHNLHKTGYSAFININSCPLKEVMCG